MNSLLYPPANSLSSMVPVYVKDATFREPADNLYFLEARGGRYLIKRSALFSASVRISTPGYGMLDHKEHLELGFDRIPHSLLCNVFGFFQMVLLRPGGEGIVFLYYSLAARTFCAKAPSQSSFCCRSNLTRDADEVHLSYGRMVRPARFVKLGTIHSHGRYQAFHSHIDDRDEKYDDGLHITMGYIHRRHPSISVSFVVNGKRFILNPEDVLDAKELVPHRPPASWLSGLISTSHNKRKRGIQGGNGK